MDYFLITQYENAAWAGDNVAFLEAEDIDVQWYSRQCTKFLRKIVISLINYNAIHDI